MANEKVLIVEDRRENLVFLSDQILRPNGYQVITASDGEAGLHRALTEAPDLIIVDFRMPKMSGIEMLRALKKEGKDIPVIVATCHGSEELAIEAFRLGARDYLIKPYEIEEMMASIDQALSSQRRFREEKSALQDDIARASKQIERRVMELQILSGIGKAVTSLHEVEAILQRIVEAATYLTNAEESFLMLVDEDSGELYMRALQGMGRKYTRFRQKVDDSMAGQVVRTGRPMRIGRGKNEETHEVVTGYLAQDLLSVPLKVRDKVIGVLGVDNIAPRNGFSENDEYLLLALADYAAIALDNARLYEIMTAQLTKMIATQSEEQPSRQEELEKSEQHASQGMRLLEASEQVGEMAEQLSGLREQLQALGASLAGNRVAER